MTVNVRTIIDIPPPLSNGSFEQQQCFLFYYPSIAGKETLPVPHELQEGKSVKDIEEMPVEARKARLLYFWLGRSALPH